MARNQKKPQIMNSQKTESNLPVFKVFRQLSAKSGLETQYLRKIVRVSVEFLFCSTRNKSDFQYPVA